MFSPCFPSMLKCFPIMKPIYIKLVFDRKKRSTATTPGAVEVRLTQDRRVLYFATGVRLLPRQWHDGQVVRRVDSAELQQQLDLLVKHIRQIINRLTEDGACSIDAVIAELRSRDHAELSFLDFAESRAKVRSYGKSEDSRERYERFLRWLTAYGEITYFSDIDDAHILAMDERLSATGMKPYSKWNNYHRFMNSFILDAIDAGYLQRNPYRWLKIEKEKSRGGLGKYLTMEELARIRALRPSTDSLCRVRDLFLFQTYTCLSYSDLATFDANKIIMINKHPCYTSSRAKTSKTFTFLILPQAMEILERYGRKLPIISNVKYNEYLKALALMADIDKPISSHWARHTGATFLLNEGLSMEIVSKVLGHSSTKITREVYAKLLDETVIKAMAKIKMKKGSR